MPGGRYGDAIRQIRTLYNGGVLGGLTDGQLLERFANRHDEAAFTALVERHGPLVLQICRCALRDPHEAQDAFQATFLVLAQHAGSIRKRESVACWLHGVASRVAAGARSAASRRRRHEQRWAELRATSETREGGDDDLGAVLHEEVQRLPERFRAALVLCYLEGLTHEQAAQRLGWPVGTVRSRLARGRERLKGRLTRRGLAPALGASLAATVADAAIPAGLVDATVQAALPLTMGEATAAGLVSASVVALTEGVLKTMFLTKLKMTATALLVLGTITSGALVVAQQGAGEERTSPPKDFKAQKTVRDLVAMVETSRVNLLKARADLEKARADVEVAEAALRAAEEELRQANDPKAREKPRSQEVRNAPDPVDIERIYRNIIQRKDRDLRRQGLDELLGLLKDPGTEPAPRTSALNVLTRIKNIPFNRTPFLPAVKPLLKSPSDAVRRAALDAMASAGAGEADLPELGKLADDPAAVVRAGVVASLYASADDKGAAIVSPIVEKLLADPSDEVKLATLHALWGKSVSPAVEEKIIALSRESMQGGPGALGYDTVYYALSTRPVVSKMVAQRLIELMQDPQMDPNVRWRAAWGLGHQATPEAVDLVVRALAAELDETLNPQIRTYAVQGLATHRTPAAMARLREVAETEENPKLREAAANALK